MVDIDKKTEKAYVPASVKVGRSSAGLGLFAIEPIKRGDFIIEYVGKKISHKEAEDHTGKYLFEINNKWTVDGADRKNIARYINHSCKPNCETEIRNGRILIFAIKNIPVGEELHYDYGEDYFDTFIKPHGCRCFKCNGKKIVVPNEKVVGVSKSKAK